MVEQNLSLGSSHARILVVDDHPMTAQTLSRALRQLGDNIEVISATSGKAALEQVKDGAVDLLITDMMMPEMNGLELIENLKAHPGGRPTYTILITAYDVPGLRESARRLKVNETIIKPVRPEHLCQVVSQALGSMKHARPSPAAAEARPSFKILIADDVAENTLLLARYLQSEGYAYIAAADGVETLEKTRAHMPDLILLDVNMPKMDGFKVLEEIRNDPALKHIPVIILTAARLGFGDLQAGFDIGADDYVTKPFDRRELLARIRSRLRVKEADDTIRRRNRELSLLPEIGRELSARTDLHELADVVLKRTVEALGALSGHLLLLNAKAPLHKEYHRPSAESRFDSVRLPLLNDLLAQMRDSRQGLIIADTRTDARWHSAPDDPTRSVVLIPLFGRSDVIGMLILHHEREHYFNEDHQLLLQAIAGQAAIAVENVQLYERVAEEQRQLSAILKGAADVILVFDADGCLSMRNPAAEQLFPGETAEIGLPLARGRGHDALIELLDGVYAAKESRSGEISWPDHRTFEALLTPIESGGCVAVLQDISHFKNLERVKNEFIATASHDLKNPISTIMGFGELIPKAGPLNEAQAGFVHRIQAASETMHELVQNMLDLARIDTGIHLDRKPVEARGLFDTLAEDFSLQAESKGQTLSFHLPEAGLRLYADAFYLKQALRNLVGNAIKYTPPGGSVTVTAETREEAAVLRVEDTGYGIPEADLPFIFDRFYRVRNETVKGIEGNGLGLAIVRSTVEQHGGRVDVQSVLGTGTCFTVTLPVAPA